MQERKRWVSMGRGRSWPDQVVAWVVGRGWRGEGDFENASDFLDRRGS